jgi:CPA1 family monovalent cation:H+ antiporter
MLLNVIELMALVIFAAVLQSNYKVPSPLSIMGVVLGCLACNIQILDLDPNEFDTLVLITLPLLITADALKLEFKDVKKHGLSLFWVAVISVLAFIGFGVMFNDYIMYNYHLPMAAVVILFCMHAATDPITVSAVFSNFKVPHKLKILTEGESLFNDATALIVFAVALVALNNPSQVTPGFIIAKSFSVIFGAIAIGLLIGFFTIWALKISEEALVEATIIIFSAYLSYWLAEHFHFSGILSVIVSILMANSAIHKYLNADEAEIEKASRENNFGLLKYAITNMDNHRTILKSVEFVSMFASAVLFVSIAAIANFEMIWSYKYEILAVFLASTVIRGLTMIKFALVSNNVDQMQSIKKHWLSVLTFAGSKGALSILMVHMLPNTFKYKHLFENIVIGNIILSTFVYAFALAVIFSFNKAKFEKECELEEAHH